MFLFAIVLLHIRMLPTYFMWCDFTVSDFIMQTASVVKFQLVIICLVAITFHLNKLLLMLTTSITDQRRIHSTKLPPRPPTYIYCARRKVIYKLR